MDYGCFIDFKSLADARDFVIQPLQRSCFRTLKRFIGYVSFDS